jgi:hypothetical protein
MGSMPGQKAGQKSGKSGLPGLGGGKGGKGAGFAGAGLEKEKNNLKLAQKAPNAKATGKRSSEKNPGPTLMFKGEPERGAKASIPYYEAHARQQKVAENAINKENIPAPYRKQVRDYFESIKP